MIIQKSLHTSSIIHKRRKFYIRKVQIHPSKSFSVTVTLFQLTMMLPAFHSFGMVALFQASSDAGAWCKERSCNIALIIYINLGPRTVQYVKGIQCQRIYAIEITAIGLQQLHLKHVHPLKII